MWSCRHRRRNGSWSFAMRTPKQAKASRGKKKKKQNASNGTKKDQSNAVGDGNARVWRPGVDPIEDGEQLDYDPTTYDFLHAMRVEWPCLSFDVLRDEKGEGRTAFPHEMRLVAGTQADVGGKNALVVAKLTNLHQGKHGKKAAQKPDDSDEEMESSDSEDEEETEEERPRLHARMVTHSGGVNRIRAMKQMPSVVATWSETGHVQVWDLRSQIQAIEEEVPEDAAKPKGTVHMAPAHVFSGHKEEGFALDWSPVVEGRLLSGDCKWAIHLWERGEGGRWMVDRTPFHGHQASVEDLQWSPTEGNVFASCSVDKTIKIWDTREKKKSALGIQASETDINVISWNCIATPMLASGDDQGILRIWDLRNFTEGGHVAYFKYHTGPVTSVEWSPFESSSLASSSEDHQVAVWDLAVERDAEEEAEAMQVNEGQAEAPEELPAQLMFVHQGQKDVKELHWHPQIPGALLTTSSDGFNIYKPSNVGPEV